MKRDAGRTLLKKLVTLLYLVRGGRRKERRIGGLQPRQMLGKKLKGA